MSEFCMPSLGADMDAGTLLEWWIKPGDSVSRGQVVAVVETDKGAIEIEIWEDGVVEQLLVEPGAKVPVGAPLARLRGEAASEVAEGEVAVSEVAGGAPAKKPDSAPAAVQASPRETVHEAPRGSSARPRISPAARRMAEERGIDIASLPVGADGVVHREDVERAAATRAEPPAAQAAEAGPAPQRPAADWQSQMRRAIAAAMARSKREIPHYYLSSTIEVGGLLDWLAQQNRARSVSQRLLPVVPFIKAVAAALAEVPELNGSYVDGAFRPSEAVHLGVAIAMRGGGLVAPAIHDADRLGLDELMAKLQELVRRVRSARLRSSDLADPSATLSSLGDLGVEQVFGVIYPPQVALVGLGRVIERPWVVEGNIVVRRVLTATVAGDHRASDGQHGARFLAALERRLRTPEKLQ